MVRDFRGSTVLNGLAGVLLSIRICASSENCIATRHNRDGGGAIKREVRKGSPFLGALYFVGVAEI